MASKSVTIKFFGLSQGIILAAILITLYFTMKRRRDRLNGTEWDLDKLDFRSAVQRVAILKTGKEKNPGPAPDSSAAALTSALPPWDASTPPHEILGVPSNADHAKVEAAYRSLLKKYHPDRFASWGKGYQTRAHHVVILLQKARETLLKKR